MSRAVLVSSGGERIQAPGGPPLSVSVLGCSFRLVGALRLIVMYFFCVSCPAGNCRDRPVSDADAFPAHRRVPGGLPSGCDRRASGQEAAWQDPGGGGHGQGGQLPGQGSRGPGNEGGSRQAKHGGLRYSVHLLIAWIPLPPCC